MDSQHYKTRIIYIFFENISYGKNAQTVISEKWRCRMFFPFVSHFFAMLLYCLFFGSASSYFGAAFPSYTFIISWLNILE